MRSLSLQIGLLAAALLPGRAWAHAEGGAHHWWTLEPWVWLPMLLLSAAYVRGMLILRRRPHRLDAARPTAIASFAAGMSCVFLALIWPLDALGSASFAAHMAQHMVLIAMAAPLLVLAAPAAPMMLGLPLAWRRPATAARAALSRLLRPLLAPGAAFAIHGTLIWLWHAPRLYEAALRHEWVHILEHGTFFGSALLFWSALARLGRGRHAQDYGAAALWCLATLIHTGMLGALLTFAPRLAYASYVEAGHSWLTPLEDQQLAGLLMWIPAGLCYLAAGLGFVAAWLRCEDRGAAGMRPERMDASADSVQS